MIRLLAIGVIVAGVASAACSKSKGDDPKKAAALPAATDWKAPPPTGPNGPAVGAVGGRAGTGAGRVRATGPNPHAGMDQANPHAGLNLPNPNGAGASVPPGASLPAPDPNRTFDPNKYLSGTLDLGAKVRNLVAAGAVVYVSVKLADSKSGLATGVAIAVDRLVSQQFPMPFHLTEANAMTQGTSFSGNVVITAWTDKDLDASTKQPGDILGSVRATIPAKGLMLVLDTIKQ